MTPSQQRKSLPLVAALASGWVVLYADRLSISPLMTVVKSEFGLNYAQVSLVITIYFITYVAFTIPATMVAERAGYRRTLVAFMGLAAVSLGLAGVLGYSYYLLLLFFAIHGVGAGAYYPTAYKVSTEEIPKENRGFSSALVNSGMGFGSILGLIIAGPVLQLFSSWQLVWVVLAFPTAAVALLLRRTVPAAPAARLQAPLLSQYRSVLRNRNLLLLCAAMFCSLYGYWVILTWGPAFLQESRDLGVFQSGAATAVFAGVAIPSSIFIGGRSDSIGRKRVALLLLPAAAATIFLMGYSTSLPEFLAAIVLYGVFGKLTLDPVVLAWVGDTTEPGLVGSSLALMNVAAMSSSILAPFITGAIADATGTLAGGFYLGAVVVLAGFVFLFLAKE